MPSVGIIGRSGRVGMAQDLAATGVELDGAADRGAVEKLQDAGKVHRAPDRRPRRGGEVLPGERGVMLQEAADNVGSSPSRWAKRYCTTNL